MDRVEKYRSIEKAAILLLSMGPNASVEIMKHLEEDEIELITKEIASLRKVTTKTKERVLREFYDLAAAADTVSYGGIDVAQELLKLSFGDEKASGFLHLMENSVNEKPFQFVHRAEPVQILNLLQYENAQTIALVLSYLDSEKAAAILPLFPADKQIQIAKRIAMMDTASPEMIQQVEKVLQERLSMTNTHQHVSKNGVESIVNILNSVDRGTEKNILETLQNEEPELAGEIKQRMFVFDDIAYLDNRSIQRILMEVTNDDLQLALRMAGQAMKDAIFRNISKRRQEGLEEALSSNEQVRVKEVEDAQGRIVSVVRKLEEDGVIIISRNGEESLVI